MEIVNISKIDCLLIYPYLEEANWKNELRSKDNLALGYLASSLRMIGYNVRIVHAEHNKYSINDIQQIVLKESPRMVGISCTAQRAYGVVKEYARVIKEVLNIPIFIGGIFPTVAYKEILLDCKHIDFISLGEGELFIQEFVKAICGGQDVYGISGLAYRKPEGGVSANYPINIIENLDELPLPSKDFFEDMKRELETGLYYINISAGRGCYGNCSFCSTNKLTGGMVQRRVRSPQNVVNEVKFFQNKYKVNYFKFVDELFIDRTNLDWIFNFCEIVKKEKIKFKFHAEARVDCISEEVIKSLKEIGLDEIFVGFESGNAEILKRYRKGHTPQMAEKAMAILRKYDINVQMGYIMIDPALSFAQLKENVIWLIKLGGYSKHNLYNKLNLYYGTDLYEQMKELRLDGDTAFYERKILKYQDYEVENFVAYIDMAKKIFDSYNREVNEYILSLLKDIRHAEKDWQEFARKINEMEVKIWTELVLRALDQAELNIKMDENWKAYVNEKQGEARQYFLNEKFC